MDTQRAQQLAARAGVDVAYVERLSALGILPDRDPDEDLTGDERRVRVVVALERGGIPVDVLGEATQQGHLDLEFVEQPAYDRFAGYTDRTFKALGDETGVPLELLIFVREAGGSARPAPDDLVRDDETRVVPFIQTLLRAGISHGSIERTLRVAGDGMRRIAETESDWWWTEVLQPLFRSGMPAREIGLSTAGFAAETGQVTDDALLALYHSQQTGAWMRNVFEAFEGTLERAGLHARIERPPAICFFDVTGYSQLTEERGDAAAADLAGRIARFVERVSVEHNGKPIKWLGDGVMVHFPEPRAAVLAALDMLEGLAREGLPSGHVGVHAGPVLFQEGDYFGRTVNAAARISDVAVNDQVLVSRDVVNAIGPDGLLAFDSIGPVALKGLLAPLELFVARRTAIFATSDLTTA
jgi:class 3 adenylate cyclase